MIRILHYGLTHNRGGIETYLSKLWNNIDRSEFHFDFIDTNIEKPCFYNEFTEMGSEFYKVTPRNKSISKNKKDLKELFEKEKFDILHCHLNTLSYVEPIKTALKSGCKVIVHSRNAGASNSFITNSLHYFHSLTLPRKKIKMVAVSDLAGKWLFGDKATVQTINNGIDLNKFKFNIQSREKLRRELGIEDKYVVGNIGAFLPAKNHQFILNVFNELSKKKPEAVLLLIGTGVMKEEIKKLVSEMNLQQKVHFLGLRTDISELLSAMDVFLFPSLYEGFPNSVLEAQCSGLPCFISDNITNEVVITDYCNQLSLSLPPSDWANKILNLQYNLARNNGSKVVNESGFSVEKEIAKIEAVYRSVLK